MNNLKEIDKLIRDGFKEFFVSFDEEFLPFLCKSQLLYGAACRQRVIFTGLILEQQEWPAAQSLNPG